MIANGIVVMRTGFGLPFPAKKEAQIYIELLAHTRRTNLSAKFIGSLQPSPDLAACLAPQVDPQVRGEFIPSVLLLKKLLVARGDPPMKRLLFGVV